MVRGRRADELARAKEHRPQDQHDHGQCEDADRAGHPVFNLNDWRQALEDHARLDDAVLVGPVAVIERDVEEQKEARDVEDRNPDTAPLVDPACSNGCINNPSGRHLQPFWLQPKAREKKERPGGEPHL